MARIDGEHQQLGRDVGLVASSRPGVVCAHLDDDRVAIYGVDSDLGGWPVVHTQDGRPSVVVDVDVRPKRLGAILGMSVVVSVVVVMGKTLLCTLLVVNGLQWFWSCVSILLLTLPLRATRCPLDFDAVIVMAVVTAE